jgi:ComF family protein
MKKNSKAIFQTLSDFIFPRHCYGCEVPLEFYEKYLCLNCQIQLPLTLFHQTTKNPLFQKLSIRFPTVSATSLFYFEKDGVLAHLIHLFKYNGVKEIGSFLGAWLGDHLKESTVKELDAIVPVPLHTVKKRKRGYNQSELIAKALSKKTKLPLLSEVLIRVKNTTALAQLGETERELEVRNAFELNFKYKDQPMHLLLVDDVLTTGATLAACASALLKNSKIKISIAVLACRL